MTHPDCDRLQREVGEAPAHLSQHSVAAALSAAPRRHLAHCAPCRAIVAHHDALQRRLARYRVTDRLIDRADDSLLARVAQLLRTTDEHDAAS